MDGRWKATLQEFCAEFAFPAQAAESLENDLRHLAAGDASAFPSLMAAREQEFRKMGEKADFSHEKTLTDLSGMAEKAGVSPFSAHLLFYILLSPILRKIYRREGISEDIFRASMEDLRCKLYECRQVYGVWGSFVAIWFARFFRLTLFGIGRLEFAPLRLDAKNAAAIARLRGEGAGLPALSPGALLIDVHIPSKGPLPHEKVLAAYRMAADFFACRYDLSGTGGEAVFFCESWMLDPGHFALFGMEGCRNILDFQADYRLFRWGKDDAGDDLWRIFGKNVAPSDAAALVTLPEDTALRRAYKRRLLAGDKPGWGMGVYLFDEKSPAKAGEIGGESRGGKGWIRK